MKRLTSGLIVLLLPCLWVQAALASEVYYLSIRSGQSTLLDAASDDLVDDPDMGELKVVYDGGTHTAGAFGWSFMDGRVELEVTDREAKVESRGGMPPSAGVRCSLQSLMFNGFYDIETWSTWNPYVGLGFGGAVLTVEEGGAEDDDLVLAYQAGGGIAVRLGNNVAVDLQYWFFVTSEYELLVGNSEYQDLLQSHNLSLGLRYYLE